MGRPAALITAPLLTPPDMRFLILLFATALAAQAQPTGTLRVQSDPPGGGIVIDGVVQIRGTIPVVTPADIPVAAGEHRVRVGLGGYTAFEETVAVGAGETATVVARLGQRSGRLALDLPPGVTATVNGEPYTGASTYPAGLAVVVVTAPDRLPMRRNVAVGPATETTVAYDPQRFRLARAGLALFGPGVAQAIDGRRARGIFFGGATLAGLVTATAMTIRASTADTENRGAQFRYDEATTEAEAVAAREEIEAQVGIVRSSRQIRGGALVAGGLVYAVSLVDAFARHVSRPGLSVSQRPAAPFSLHLTGTGAGLALRF